MANAINYAEKYQKELDQHLRQTSLTAELETPQVNWLDAKTFKLPRLAVSGYKTHSRNGGFNAGDVTVTHTPYVLSFDRDIEFFVDRADVDESNQAASASNVSKVFMETKGVPEMDAYRFSKLATGAITNTKFAAEAITSANVYTKLKAAILPVRKYGAGNIVIYVSSAVMDALEQSTAFTRSINVESGASAIDTRVTSIDGVRIVEVWDADRFYTAFDFTTGYVPAAGGKAINFLVVTKPAVIAKAKLSAIYLFPPGGHTKGDGFLYQNRLYHDLFIVDSMKDGVYVSHVV